MFNILLILFLAFFHSADGFRSTKRILFHNLAISLKNSENANAGSSWSFQQSLRPYLAKTLPLAISAALIWNPSLYIERTLAEESSVVVTAAWSPGVTYTIVKSGEGPTPKVGDIVGIRFTGSYKGNVFDNTFKTEEPYLYRCGVGRYVV